MKKFVYIIFAIFCFLFINKTSFAGENTEENILKIREGAFAKAMVREEFSTLTSDIGDEVTFINTQDMYVYETNAIPENTIFYGIIEDVLEPVKGKDGALKISIYKMITPDKKVYKLSAHIYSENDNYIGGRNTGSVYYHRVLHHSQGLRPFLKVAPLNVYEEGKHTIVKPGAELFIIFEKDVLLK